MRNYTCMIIDDEKVSYESSYTLYLLGHMGPNKLVTQHVYLVKLILNLLIKILIYIYNQ